MDGSKKHFKEKRDNIGKEVIYVVLLSWSGEVYRRIIVFLVENLLCLHVLSVFSWCLYYLLYILPSCSYLKIPYRSSTSVGSIKLRNELVSPYIHRIRYAVEFRKYSVGMTQFFTGDCKFSHRKVLGQIKKSSVYHDRPHRLCSFSHPNFFLFIFFNSENIVSKNQFSQYSLQS